MCLPIGEGGVMIANPAWFEKTTPDGNLVFVSRI
jgi:hypothetical protein